jgi:hypothetical protein
VSYAHRQRISASDYNTLAGLTSTAAGSAGAAASVAGYLYGIGYGDRGYGQSSPPLSAVSSGQVVTNWTSLRTVLSNLCTWQNTSASLLPSAAGVAQGAAVIAHPTGETPSIPDLLSLLDTNRLNFQAGNMSLTASAAASTRGSAWGSGTTGITSEFSVTFADENAARYFFNTGGEIRIALHHPSTATSQDSNWNGVLNNLSVGFRANTTARLTGSTGTPQPVGYYQLTTSYQTIHDGINTGTGLYSSNDYVIQARALSITGVNGAKGSVIYFKVTLTDEHTNAFSDSVSSGTVATLSHLRAGAVLSSLPAAPTCAVVTAF